MKVICLIPARMGSSRFPGKPLKNIKGLPMIEHVYKRTRLSKTVNKVAVATPDKEISDFVKSFGGNVIMTSPSHERASDRCAEALLIEEKKDNLIYDIVVMVQGDEPLVHPRMIDDAVNEIQNDINIKVVNLLGNLTEEEYKNKNIIKVIVNKKNNAIYFSRISIPYSKKLDLSLVGKQICVIPFRRDFLLDYSNLKPSPLEIAESIDMLRVLEYGYDVRMTPCELVSHPVDVEEDIIRVEKLLDKDEIYQKGY
tara:strand:+ start:2593 stop:3354 length:762 start_codon:yes stop_codon:yes gene_type:complete